MKKKLLITISLLFISFNLFALDYTSILIENANNGDLASQKSLAKMYLEGNGLGKNLEKSFQWINKAAEQKDAEALFILYNYYKNGIGCPQQERIDILIESAKLGFPQALGEAGRIALNIPGQEESAIQWLRYAYEKGEKSVLPIIGGYYMSNGDYQHGIDCFNKALVECENNIDISNAYIGLSKVFAGGYGVSIDIKKAKEYINRAIKLSPDYISCYEQKGIILIQEGNIIEAKEIWNKMLKLAPSYTLNSRSILAQAMNESIDYGIPFSNAYNTNTIGIIIANENYKRVPNVPHAINDGTVFKKYLTSTFGIPDENIEYLEDASLNDIKYALSNVSQRCEAFKNQLSVIVYYAGHGVPDDKNNEAYLLPVDGFGTDPKSGLNMEDFYENLSEMPAKSVVVLLDACFSGAKRDGGMLMATRGITIKPNMKVPDGKLIVLSATAEDQTAFPIEDQKHGLFTYTLLRKIQETNGDITWGELADYVTETVKTRSIDLAGKLQSPTVSVSPSIKDTWRNLKIR